MPMAGVPVSAPVAVKSMVPAVIVSVWLAPVPATATEPAVRLALLTTSALIVCPASPGRSPVRDSRMLSVKPASVAKVLNSVARSSGRSPEMAAE